MEESQQEAATPAERIKQTLMEDMASYVVESILTRVSSELIGSEVDNFLLMETIFESMLKSLVQ